MLVPLIFSCIDSTVSVYKMNHADIYERPMDEESKVGGHHESHVNQHLHLRTASFPVPKPVDRIAFKPGLWCQKPTILSKRVYLFNRDTGAILVQL
ncbi:hypothetical protein KHA80_20525 [Anaerobacillus sp. HL2]|nr:hypothetical protein KHA80_20525 [Anaerobacillus sp. HL2]